MNKNTESEYRSLGEAHLYIAIAKADGIITTKERVRAPYYAQKSQDVFNVLKINKNIKQTIKKHVSMVLLDKKFISWNAEQHLDEAVLLLKNAEKNGDWGVSLSFHKNENGLLEVAFLDGYIYKESKFIKEIEKRLSVFE